LSEQLQKLEGNKICWLGTALQAQGPLRSFLFEIVCLFIFFQVCHIQCYVLFCLDFVNNQNFTLQESDLLTPLLGFQRTTKTEMAVRKLLPENYQHFKAFI